MSGFPSKIYHAALNTKLQWDIWEHAAENGISNCWKADLELQKY